MTLLIQMETRFVERERERERESERDRERAREKAREGGGKRDHCAAFLSQLIPSSLLLLLAADCL